MVMCIYQRCAGLQLVDVKQMLHGGLMIICIYMIYVYLQYLSLYIYIYIYKYTHV